MSFSPSRGIRTVQRFGRKFVRNCATLRRRLSMLIHSALREFRKIFTGLLLLRESRFQKLDGLLETKFGGPGFKRAVTCDLIMLDRLCRSQQASIQGGHSLVFLHDLLTFLKDAHDGVAR